jgi:hypothetical protein
MFLLQRMELLKDAPFYLYYATYMEDVEEKCDVTYFLTKSFEILWFLIRIH